MREILRGLVLLPIGPLAFPIHRSARRSDASHMIAPCVNRVITGAYGAHPLIGVRLVSVTTFATPALAVR